MFQTTTNRKVIKSVPSRSKNFRGQTLIMHTNGNLLGKGSVDTKGWLIGRINDTGFRPQKGVVRLRDAVGSESKGPNIGGQLGFCHKFCVYRLLSRQRAVGVAVASLAVSQIFGQGNVPFTIGGRFLQQTSGSRGATANGMAKRSGHEGCCQGFGSEGEEGHQGPD